MSTKKVLAITIDGVIRDFFDQFDTVYRKKFIKNQGIVQMTENYEFLPEDEESENAEYERLENIANSLIHLPLTTYSLRNHYEFESNEIFENFLYQDNVLELFGSASQIPFAMEQANKIYNIKQDLGISDVILFCPGKNQVITATLHFLLKSSCKIGHIIFSENPLDVWEYADIVLTDNPNILDAKPKDKKTIKLKKDYNTSSLHDVEINSIKEIDLRMLENFIKNNIYN